MKKVYRLLIIVLGIIILMLLLFVRCPKDEKESSAKKSKEPAQTAAEEQQPPASQEEIVDTFEISTPYAILKYPQKWKDQVTVDISTEKVSFSSSGTPLFDLRFNCDDGYVLGTIIGEEENTVFSITDYSVENEELAGMQEDVNIILQHLMSDYDFAVGEKVIKEDTSTFDIETPLVTMKYPSKWKDKVTIDVREDGVSFSCAGTQLFDLMFVSCDGYLLGTYNGTPIYIIDYPIDGGELCAMQEDVNVILEHLMQDEQFTINQT